MTDPEPLFDVKFARNSDDILAVQRLRYDVFVSELGSDGPLVDHVKTTEADYFDNHADHLILRDLTRAKDDQVVGVYRLMNMTQAIAANGFSCENEYDLTALRETGRPLLELGRSCLHPDYRGGIAMFHIWQALAAHISATGIEILFGVASFHGAEPAGHADALAMLFADHDSPFQVPSRQPAVLPAVIVDRKRALRATPALIKAYLRLGGAVGQGAFVDHAFNTTDVCMILDVAQMSPRQKAIYAR